MKKILLILFLLLIFTLIGLCTWYLPTAHFDSENTWDNETLIYDDNDTTAGTTVIGAKAWSDFIILDTYSGLEILQIKFLAYQKGVLGVEEIDIDLYYDSQWNDLYEGVFNDQVWTYIDVIPSQLSNEARVRFYAKKADTAYLYGFEFENLTYTSQYPPAQSDDYVKATTKNSTDLWPYYTTDPAKPLTGAYTNNCWVSLDGQYVEQRFHIDLGSAKIIRRIYYENGHVNGAYTDRAPENFTFQGSNTEASFLELTYATDTGWTNITTAQGTFDEHVALDQADPKYMTVTNTTAYRYYAFKFADNYKGDRYMAVRRIELQTEDGYPPVAGITWNDIEISKWNNVEISKWNGI